MEEKILKIAKFADNPSEAQFEQMLDLEDKLEEKHSEMMECVSQVTEHIKQLPTPLDYTEKLQEIIDKLEEPEEIEVELNII